MFKLTLLKLRLNPLRLLLAVGVAVFTLFVFSLGWLQVTKVAKRKVETTVAKVSKKLGVPIEIGRFTITPLGAHFEDLRIGQEANIVISRVTAEVGLNPFSSGFGELDSVTVYKVRVKSGLARFKESVTSLKEAGLIESDKSASTQKSLEKVFAALPTKRLQLKSGAVTILDDDGKVYLTARGAQLVVDKVKTKVLFRLENVKTRDGLSDSYLQGRFELNPDTDAYRFFVRRKAALKSSRNAWAVSGLIKKDFSSADLALDFKSVPAVLADATERFLGKSPRLGIKGTVSAVREGDTWNFETNLTSNATRINMPLLSPKPVGPVRFNIQGKGFVKPDEHLFALESADISVPLAKTGRYGRSPVHLTARGAGRFPAAAGESFAVEGQLQLLGASCQTVLDSAPPGLLPALAGFKLDGLAAFALTFAFDSQKPEAVAVDMHDGTFGCRVLKAPFTYSAEHLSGPFSLEREVGKDDEPLEINVSPLSPNFAPLANVSKLASQAFVTSEDASFFQHNGIDAAALQYAIKRNLSEKRVAVGGSTITMQTVKNLFLTQERTISRKLQELFLAWHLDRVLSKDRILEIYMNIAELGPGIYGVQQASEHYFGKRASDLNLLESAYLASLLPSPKTRYRYFCDGKLTPNFQSMVHGLLKRMVNLNRVNYDRYLQAMSASIQFDDSERQSARECSRQAAVPQDDEDPS